MLNILIVDSHPIVRTGLDLFLNSKPDFNVVGTLNSGIEIFEFVRRNDVDIIISEIDLPELNGITALRAIKKENKDVRVLIFSHQPEEIYAVSTIKAGASGYLSKSASVEEIEILEIKGVLIFLIRSSCSDVALLDRAGSFWAEQKKVLFQASESRNREFLAPKC